MTPPRITKIILFLALLSGILAFPFPWILHAADTDVFTVSVKPNVLVILDNSNSMDEDFFGNAVGSFSSSSKSVVGKKVLIDLINAYVNPMRIGLMSYRLPSSSKQYLHNSAYFVSYEPKSYCPNPPDECVNFCQTGNGAAQATCQSTCAAQNSLFDATYLDEIISTSPIGTQKRTTYCNLIYPKTNQIPNPTHGSDYLYYKMALPFYDTANDGTLFFYSPGYSSVEYPPQYNSYKVYQKKTGTSDQENNYSQYYTTWGLVPTDSDYALGYANFGRRLFSYYVGRTWFANNSPGNGYLHIQAQDNNPATDNQLSALSAKLRTYEGDESGYMSCASTGDPNSCSYIVNAGLTPTAGVLQSAINYFSGSSTPIQYSCQKNFIIYVTDGLPSVSESGSAGTATSLMPAVLDKLNRLRALTVGSNTYDITTYVVGVGLTRDDKILLDTMAAAGGTDIGGHAYYADNPSQLQTALGNVFFSIIENSYSFSLVSVTSTRRIDENYLYEASFEPVGGDPLWKGHLRKYSIQNDGSMGNAVWDAGYVLQSTDPSSRSILTYLNGSMTNFAGIPGDIKHYLNVGDQSTATAIVGYFQGQSAYNPDNWKLGDIMHSNPITVGSPSFYFTDVSAPNAFSSFRENNRDRERLVFVGANDGQFRAFSSQTGSEKWSFIPPNLLPKLQYIYHLTHPFLSLYPHQYMVDGPVSVTDIWLGAGDGSSKLSDDWRTLLVFGEGRGVRDATNTTAQYLWSKSSSCDDNFNYYYSHAYKYYCGYWAFDVTNTSATTPTLKWRLNPDATQAPFWGEPWSKMAIGRVKISGNEKWVGFVGGGYNNDGDVDRGRGFFVVDLSDGSILWSYTRGNDTGMAYSIPASPAIADTDNDGFIDTAYIGDLGGNVWRFTFCIRGDGPSCGLSNWAGGRLFQSSTATPIYTTPTVARKDGIWVFWGTGDKENPTTPGSQDRFFGVTDDNRTGTFNLALLQDITASIFSGTSPGWYISLNAGEKVLADSSAFGGMIVWTTYIPYTGSDLCIRAGSAKLYAVAMATLPVGGVSYQTGAGLLGASAGNVAGVRSIVVGAGIAQIPVFSQKPGGTGATDLYVTTSGGAGQASSVVTTSELPDSPLPQRLRFTNPLNQILHWRDQRVQ
jgi:type IV pilus assembly protein PilY1